MMRRCYNDAHHAWPHYGGRGITVCPRWHKFELYYADTGDPPKPGLKLDRTDNDGDYGPDNWRWVTQSEQLKNRRSLPRRPKYPPFDVDGHLERIALHSGTMDTMTEMTEKPPRLTPALAVNHRQEMKPLPLRVASAQYARLTKARDRTGISIQEHIRRAIDVYLASTEREAIELGLMPTSDPLAHKPAGPARPKRAHSPPKVAKR
jgi:hypothetical protein